MRRTSAGGAVPSRWTWSSTFAITAAKVLMSAPLARPRIRENARGARNDEGESHEAPAGDPCARPGGRADERRDRGRPEPGHASQHREPHRTVLAEQAERAGGGDR